jgi:hypothetical protein
MPKDRGIVAIGPAFSRPMAKSRDLSACLFTYVNTLL